MCFLVSGLAGIDQPVRNVLPFRREFIRSTASAKKRSGHNSIPLLRVLLIRFWYQ